MAASQPAGPTARAQFAGSRQLASSRLMVSMSNQRRRNGGHPFLRFLAVAVCLVIAFVAGTTARDSGALAGVDAWRQSITQDASDALGRVLGGSPSTGQSQQGQSQQGQYQDGQSQQGQSSEGWSQDGQSQDGSGTDQPGGSNWSGSQSQQQDSTTTNDQATTSASTQQATGVVVIQAELADQNSVAAGTGMVLTSDGLVLTNNHVVAGASSIQVEVVATGRTYRAVVVGRKTSADVAVLKLVGASDLATVRLNTSGDLAVDDQVTGVGNAGGTGVLVAAAGKVAALDQHVTTQAEGSAASESLSGLIQVDAQIRPGDSGGPLLDADGRVVGMDTAASTGAVVTGFAIPITTALRVADQLLQAAGSDLTLAA